MSQVFATLRAMNAFENTSPAQQRLEAAWIDHCQLRDAYSDLPHNAPDWERRALAARVDESLERVRRAEAAIAAKE